MYILICNVYMYIHVYAYIYICTYSYVICICTYMYMHTYTYVSHICMTMNRRIDKFIGLFCKRAPYNRLYSAKETCNFINSHTYVYICITYMYDYE